MNKKPQGNRGTTYRKPGVKGVLRVIPVGGLEEVGRNMMIIEYERDIVIVDMGFQFPEEHTPGIDYIIPNIEYLKGKEKNIRGVLITHGHLDHVGAVSYLVPKLGNPAIFATPFSAAMIQKRHDEFKGIAPLNLHTVTEHDQLKLGAFGVEFFRVNHNIPDSVGIVIHSPVGSVMHTGDFKFDHSPVREKPADIAKIARFGSKGILALAADSTSCMVEGHAISEKVIGQTLARLIHDAKGRVIVGTFSSLIPRIQQLFWICEKLGKKLVLEGYSMKVNSEIAKELGIMKYDESTLLTWEQAKNLPPNQVVIACTGAQGEDNAALMKIANREHRSISIRKGDTVIFSSSVIPGNERSVQGLMDTLTREGADIFNYKMMDVHTGGHAHEEDIKTLLRLVKPKHYIPIHGNRFMLKINGDIAMKTGVRPENVFICDNGQVVAFDKDGKGRLTKEKIPTDYVMVDGLGVGDVSEVVLRDRKHMADDGMFVVILKIDAKTGELVGHPDVISRGFVYLKENKDFIHQSKRKIKTIMQRHTKKASPNDQYVRNKIRDEIGKYLFQKTHRRPMVIPVVIEV